MENSIIKRNRIYKRPKDGGSILVTVKKLEKLSELREGKFTSRDYKDLRRMQLIDPSVRDAIQLLKQLPLELLLGVYDKAVFGRGKRIFVLFDGEDDIWYHFFTSIHTTCPEQPRCKRSDPENVFRA